MKVQPIAVPTIPVEEIREVTKGFGDEALIGEGSFGRVYFGVLKNGRSAAIKKLDSSKQPEQEFLAQVCFGFVSELCIFASLSVSYTIYVYTCRSQWCQDLSMTMLWNCLVTVLMETPVFLLMNLLLWVLFTICFMVMPLYTCKI